MDPASPEGASPQLPDGFPARPLIVGIGASAGGLEAVSQLLRHLPAEPGMAFVLVQHLDPKHESSLVELLSRVSAMPVREVVDGTLVEPDHLYVIAPDTVLSLQGLTLHLAPRAGIRNRLRLIDEFLYSLAAECGDRCFGVILSGTGADGTLGIERIKAAGGVTFAQDASAAYDGMPRSAIAGGGVDFILPPQAIAEELVRIGRQLGASGESDDGATTARYSDEDLVDVFALLHRASGVDFAEYKQSTVVRRLRRRMVVREIEALDDYVRLLRTSPEEVDALFRDILIHVTSFFRDPETFDALIDQVIPRLLEARSVDAPIRVWVPGCSTGEEVYSLAICLTEFLEQQAVPHLLKIFGTDLAEAEIAKARAGRYPATISRDVSPERLSRFFVPEEGGYQISKAIRDQCVFARQDATRDPPFSNLDLISCRNTLIYLGPVLQKRVLPTLHYALREGGYLLLGRAESVGSSNDLFSALDTHHRIYVRRSVPSRLVMGDSSYADRFDDGASPGSGPGPGRAPRPVSALEMQREADRIILARYAPAAVVVDDAFEIIQFRGNTEPYLVAPSGVPSHNLLKMARRGLMAGLRAAIEDAKATDGRVRREGLWLGAKDRSVGVDVEVVPIGIRPSLQRCYLVLFQRIEPTAGGDGTGAGDGTAASELGDVLVERMRIAALERELEAMDDRLHEVLEHHEAADEELRAANEEILSSNEELQSTNEELQTAKEELQATNEELITINEELEHRNQEANLLSSDLSNLLTSANIPIVMLDRDLRIRRATPHAANVLKLRTADLGRRISDITLPIQTPELEPLLSNVVATGAVNEMEVQDRDARWFVLGMRPTRTAEGRLDGAVITLVDIDATKRSEQCIEAARQYADNIFQTVREPLLILDHELRVKTANRSFYEMFAVTPTMTEGRPLWELSDGRWDVAKLRGLLRAARAADVAVDDVEVIVDLGDRGRRNLLLHARRVHGEDEWLVLLSIADVTERKRAEQARLALELKLQQTQKRESLGVMAGGIAHDFNNILTAILGNVSLATDQIRRTDPLVPYLESIGDSATRAAELCQQMLAYSGKGQFVVRRLSLSELVRGSSKLLQISVGRAAVLRLELADDLPAVLADATQIRQVLTNLVTNAAEALGESGGAITVSTGHMTLTTSDLARCVVQPDQVAPGYVYLDVADDGSGMTAAIRAQVFDPFFTTKFTGRGLGLAAVLGIVRGHQGALLLDSDPGQGATFRILLPAVDQPAEVLAPVVPATVSWRGTGLVLVVDDEPEVRGILSLMLGRLGFAVVEANGGQDAVAVVQTGDRPIVAALLDVTMPVMGGAETLQNLRRLRPDLPVLLMSGYSADDVVADAVSQPLTGFLAKPIRLAELASGLREVLEA